MAEKRPASSDVTMEPAAKRALLMLSSQHSLGVVTSSAELNMKVLVFQNKKLTERAVEEQKLVAQLRKRIEQLETRQQTDEAIVMIINRYWNQLDEDVRVLLQRFDAETSDENENQQENEETKAYLRLLQASEETELTSRLSQRVEFSKRAVGKLLQAFDHLLQRQHRLQTSLLQSHRHQGKAGDVTVPEVEMGSGVQQPAAPPTGAGDGDKEEITPAALAELEREMRESVLENKRLHRLLTSLQQLHHQDSLKMSELRDQAAHAESSQAELRHRLEEAELGMEGEARQAARLAVRLQEALHSLDMLRQAAANNQGNLTSQPDPALQEKRELEAEHFKLSELETEAETQRELATSRLQELDRLSQDHQDCLKEVERLKIELRHLPEAVIQESGPFQSLQKQLDLLERQVVDLEAENLRLMEELKQRVAMHIFDIQKFQVEETMVTGDLTADMPEWEARYEQLHADHERLTLRLQHAEAERDHSVARVAELQGLHRLAQDQVTVLKLQSDRLHRCLEDLRRKTQERDHHGHRDGLGRLPHYNRSPAPKPQHPPPRGSPMHSRPPHQPGHHSSHQPGHHSSHSSHQPGHHSSHQPGHHSYPWNGSSSRFNPNEREQKRTPEVSHSDPMAKNAFPSYPNQPARREGNSGRRSDRPEHFSSADPRVKKETPYPKDSTPIGINNHCPSTANRNASDRNRGSLNCDSTTSHQVEKSHSGFQNYNQATHWAQVKPMTPSGDAIVRESSSTASSRVSVDQTSLPCKNDNHSGAVSKPDPNPPPPSSSSSDNQGPGTPQDSVKLSSAVDLHSPPGSLPRVQETPNTSKSLNRTECHPRSMSVSGAGKETRRPQGHGGPVSERYVSSSSSSPPSDARKPPMCESRASGSREKMTPHHGGMLNAPHQNQHQNQYQQQQQQSQQHQQQQQQQQQLKQHHVQDKRDKYLTTEARGELDGKEMDRLRHLRGELKRLEDARQEMRLLLQDFKKSPSQVNQETFNRIRIKLLEADRKTSEDIQGVMMRINLMLQGTKEQRSKMAEEDAYRRVKKQDDIIADLQRRLANYKVQEERLMHEMELTSQMFRGLDDQNLRLRQQIEIKDAANFKLVSEATTARTLSKQNAEVIKRMTTQVETLEALVAASNAQVAAMRSSESQCHNYYTNAFDEFCSTRNALRHFKSKMLQHMQTAADLELHLDKYRQQLKEAQAALSEKSAKLSKQSFKQKRLEEEVVRLNKKLERTRKIELSGGVEQVLMEEIKEYKAQLFCPSCKVNQKNAVLRTCFHVFCLECLRSLYETRQRKCPECQAGFGANDFQRLYLA